MRMFETVAKHVVWCKPPFEQCKIFEASRCEDQSKFERLPGIFPAENTKKHLKKNEIKGYAIRWRLKYVGLF